MRSRRRSAARGRAASGVSFLERGPWRRGEVDAPTPEHPRRAPWACGARMAFATALQAVLYDTHPAHAWHRTRG
eukprot:3585217-Prymnesium_polylepis.1